MARIVVLGAGIVGASAAYRLAAAGHRVVVLDNADPARATSAGAGIIATIGSRPAAPEVDSFRFAAARHYAELVGAFEAADLVDHSYGVVGELTVALDEAEQERIPEEFARSTALVTTFGTEGVGEPELWDRTEIRRRYPQLSTALGGVWLPGVARVDGRVIRDALLELAVRAGAEVRRVPAQLQRAGDAVTGVLTPSGRLPADVVVLAAGAWSTPLAAEVEVELGVYPQRGQIVHLHLPGGSELPAVSSMAGHYLLSFPDDRVVVGATREDDSGFDGTLTAGGLAEVLGNGMALAPSLAQARWIEARSGSRPVSRDGNPWLGPATGVDGLWIATGMGASGLTVGPYAGAVLARAIDGQDAETPGAFNPGRTVAG